MMVVVAPSEKFQEKHVVPGSSTWFPESTDKMAAFAQNRLDQHPAKTKGNTAISGTPIFTKANGFGKSRTSWEAHKLVTVNPDGSEIVQHGPVWGRTGEDGTVAHYDGVDREAQYLAAWGGGAVVGALGNIADYHIFKDSKVQSASRIGQHASAHGSCGSAMAEVGARRASKQVKESIPKAIKVHAGAHVVKAEARSKWPNPDAGDLVAPFASGEYVAANSSAEVCVLGARASADATTVRVQAGFAGTPFCVGAEGPGCSASAGLHLQQIGASVGIHVGQANAGPFAVRAGVKFGGGIENGVPVAHLGPVSAPCAVM